MPNYLPPLPKDHVYLGRRGEFKVSDRFIGRGAHKGWNNWSDDCNYAGNSDTLYYSAHKDSPIVALNGGPYKSRKKPAKVEPIDPPAFVDIKKYYGVKDPIGKFKGFIVGTKYKNDEYRVVCTDKMTEGNGWTNTYKDGPMNWAGVIIRLKHLELYEFKTFAALAKWLTAKD